MSVLFEKDEVVKFLASFHEENYEGPISKIKLQKGLYFLYAYYAQFLHRARGSEISDEIGEDYPTELFTPNFQAWSYGPVDYTVYKEHDKIIENVDPEIIDVFLKKPENEFVQDYLDTMTRQIFNSNDFGLVELSHRDDCWKDNYDENDSEHRTPITAAEIIAEYAH